MYLPQFLLPNTSRGAFNKKLQGMTKQLKTHPQDAKQESESDMKC